MSGDENMDCGVNDECEPQIFNPKKHKLDPEEKLEMDESAYVMYHEMKVEHSCLTFDIISDKLGGGTERSETYPYTLSAISGSQAAPGHNNMLTVMKMSNLHKIKQKEGDDNDSDSESDEEDAMLDNDTELVYANIAHNGGVNRVRTTVINGQTMAASWSDLGHVHIWDLTKPIWAIDDSAYMAEYLRANEIQAPLYTVRTHKTEGFAIDWSKSEPGMLASGDNNGCIWITNATEHGKESSSKAAMEHQNSVEDIQWSPNQSSIFASCSSDGSIVIWDTRDMRGHITMAKAHSLDVNVISWNRMSPVSLVSGGDDGLVKVWDLRMMSGSVERACTHVYNYHEDNPITSVEWCPGSQYVFACSSQDDQLTLWDISMEQEVDNVADVVEEYPVHLLFNHMGQKEVKEVHWHPQIPGLLLSTGLEGFNVFRTISV